MSITYKAQCPLCNGYLYTYERYNRIILCHMCENFLIPSIQGIVRGFLVRNKIQRLRCKELVHRWVLTKGFSGKDISRTVSKFL